MDASLEVLFSPAEFNALGGRDLSQVVCVVFDVLRATSSMVTALANGARAIFPVQEISEALRLRAEHPSALLAGERHGLRIVAAQAGGVDFDLGNSPREFTRERVAGRDIIMTTTNGTRALQSCRGAHGILAGSFLNLHAVAGHIRQERIRRLLVVCAGTFEDAAYEDTLAAGALCDLVGNEFAAEDISDSAHMAREIYLDSAGSLENALERSRNARRLRANPDLRDDVPFCFRRNTIDLVAELREDAVRVR